MKTNSCPHPTPANDICFVCPIMFDWQRMPAIPHTFSASIAGFIIGRYDQPSDGSTWISITGPAGIASPYNPKKFPDRISAELWAADTVRLLTAASTGETSMNPDPNEQTGVPDPVEPKPGQQPPFDPANQPKEEPLPVGDDEPGDDEVELEDDDGSTGFEDEDDEDE